MPPLPLVPVPADVRASWERELHQVLEWWEANMVDHEFGGFYGRRDAYSRLQPQADKGIILNARLLWSFSHMARHIGRSSYQAMADRAYHFLETWFLDPEHGGVYWMLDATGRAVTDKKQVYAQAFAIYALSEYYRLTRDKRVIMQAWDLFDLLDQHSRDADIGGYLEAFTRDWQLLNDLRLSHKDLNEAKTMNTHLHVMEAYTNLYRVDPQPRLRERLQELVQLFIDHFVDPNSHHLYLFFSSDWESRSREISYGHDIETSWLLCDTAAAIHDEGHLRAVRLLAPRIARATFEGIDMDGGLINLGDPMGYTDTDKHWWPQFEALVGFLNAWQITPEEQFRQAALRVWRFADQFHRDREGGEWHWCLDRQGRPNYKEDKAGPWKAPYHVVRSLQEALRRTKVLPV